MGARGKRPQPPEVALRRGNPGRRNRKALELAASADTPRDPDATSDIGIPAPPLPLTKAARRHWSNVAAILSNRRQLKDGDLVALARYCNHLSDYESLRASIIDKRGVPQLTYKTTNTVGDKVYKARPEVGMMRELEPKLLAIEREFGLTPSARAGVAQKIIAAGKTIPTPPSPPATDAQQRQHPDGSPPTPAAPASPLGLLKPKTTH